MNLWPCFRYPSILDSPWIQCRYRFVNLLLFSFFFCVSFGRTRSCTNESDRHDISLVISVCQLGMYLIIISSFFVTWRFHILPDLSSVVAVRRVGF